MFFSNKNQKCGWGNMAWKDVTDVHTDGYGKYEYKHRKEWVDEPKNDSDYISHDGGMSDITMKIIIFGSMGLGFLFGQNMPSTITMGVIGGIIVVLISYLKRKK